MNRYKVFVPIDLLEGIGPDEEITVSHFTLKLFSEEELATMSDANSLDSWDLIKANWISALADRPVVYFHVTASNVKKAQQRAEEEFARFVNRMRFICHFQTYTIWRQLLFRPISMLIFTRDGRTPQLVDIPKNQNEWVALGWSSQHRHALHRKKTLLDEIEGASFPTDIKNRVERALYWIGKMTLERESHLRIIFGIAALENLLYKKRERANKALLLPARIMALNSANDSGFMDPGLVAGLVCLRNELIHEGIDPLRADSRNVHTLTALVDQVTVDFLALCSRMRFEDFNAVMRHLKEEKGSDLIAWLERVKDSRNSKTVEALIREIQGAW